MSRILLTFTVALRTAVVLQLNFLLLPSRFVHLHNEKKVVELGQSFQNLLILISTFVIINFDC